MQQDALTSNRRSGSLLVFPVVEIPPAAAHQPCGQASHCTDHWRTQTWNHRGTLFSWAQF